MVVYRIAHQRFINNLDGIGAMRYGGRWNPQGVACLYCSEHLSLAFLEKLVHVHGADALVNLYSIALNIPDHAALYTIDVQKMISGWQQQTAYTSWLGKQLLSDAGYMGFRVPSVVVPQEWNVVLNPAHPLISKIVANEAMPFVVDTRLSARLTDDSAL